MMDEKKKRRVFSSEFKARVGLEAVRRVKTLNEIARDYEIHQVQICKWKKVVQGQAKTLFEGRRGPMTIENHQEIERLYGEIGRLKMELDLLKKKPEIVLT